MKFIACCSVLPSRVEHKGFQETVKTFAEDARIEKVYIFYPSFCKRLNTPYPEVPKWMKRYEKVEVRRVDDMGPATKLLPFLDIVPQQQNVGIVLFDDDRLFPIGWFDPLFEAFTRYEGKSGVARHGSLHATLPFRYDYFNQRETDERFHCAKTTFGVIYPRIAFPPTCREAKEFIARYKDVNSETNDDIMIASWCHQTKTPIYIIPSTEEELTAFDACNNVDECDTHGLSLLPKHIDRQFKLVSKMIHDGNFPMPWADVWTYVALILLLIVFFILFAVVLRL
jgi:hypothetical protein